MCRAALLFGAPSTLARPHSRRHDLVLSDAFCLVSLSGVNYFFGWTTTISPALGLVLGEIEVVIHNKPDDFLVGHRFYHFHRAPMRVFVVILPHIAEICGAAFDVFRPPATGVGDGGEGYFWRLVH